MGGQSDSVVRDQLTDKHKMMARDPVQFLRGTFYRWVQSFPRVCPDLAKLTVVLGVGDLHIASFGTWRDGFGRLIWGVDDFDEAYSLPYTNDLVRLAVSAVLDASEGAIAVGVRNIAMSFWKDTARVWNWADGRSCLRRTTNGCEESLWIVSMFQPISGNR